MQATTLLDENANPSDAEIKECLKDTYCRCTGYTAIINSVKAAGEYMRTGTMPDAELPAVIEPLSQIGPTIGATGRGRQGDGGGALHGMTIPSNGMLFGATLRSEHPHAHIREIDTEAARALDGVHAVLTHADVPGDPRHGLVENDWPVFGRRDAFRPAM